MMRMDDGGNSIQDIRMRMHMRWGEDAYQRGRMILMSHLEGTELGQQLSSCYDPLIKLGFYVNIQI